MTCLQQVRRHDLAHPACAEKSDLHRFHPLAAREVGASRHAPLPAFVFDLRYETLAIPFSQMPSDRPSGIVDLGVGLSAAKPTAPGPLRESRDADSLFLETFSLIRLRKFPVPLRREFGCKPLNPPVDQPRELRWMVGFCKNSLLISLLAGKFGCGELVRG